MRTAYPLAPGWESNGHPVGELNPSFSGEALPLCPDLGAAAGAANLSPELSVYNR